MARRRRARHVAAEEIRSVLEVPLRIRHVMTYLYGALVTSLYRTVEYAVIDELEFIGEEAQKAYARNVEWMLADIATALQSSEAEEAAVVVSNVMQQMLDYVGETVFGTSWEQIVSRREYRVKDFATLAALHWWEQLRDYLGHAILYVLTCAHALPMVERNLEQWEKYIPGLRNILSEFKSQLRRRGDIRKQMLHFLETHMEIAISTALTDYATEILHSMFSKEVAIRTIEDAMAEVGLVATQDLLENLSTLVYHRLTRGLAPVEIRPRREQELPERERKILFESLLAPPGEEATAEQLGFRVAGTELPPAPRIPVELIRDMVVRGINNFLVFDFTDLCLVFVRLAEIYEELREEPAEISRRFAEIMIRFKDAIECAVMWSVRSSFAEQGTLPDDLTLPTELEKYKGVAWEPLDKKYAEWKDAQLDMAREVRSPRPSPWRHIGEGARRYIRMGARRRVHTARFVRYGSDVIGKLTGAMYDSLTSGKGLRIEISEVPEKIGYEIQPSGEHVIFSVPVAVNIAIEFVPPPKRVPIARMERLVLDVYGPTMGYAEVRDLAERASHGDKEAHKELKRLYSRAYASLNIEQRFKVFYYGRGETQPPRPITLLSASELREAVKQFEDVLLHAYGSEVYERWSAQATATQIIPPEIRVRVAKAKSDITRAKQFVEAQFASFARGG